MFRVSASYGVVAWVLMQIGEVTFPALHLPDWMLTALVVILLIGFPIVAIIAWIFDKTPEGIVRTQFLDSDQVAPTTKVGKMEVKVDTHPFYLQKKNIFLLLGVIAGILIGQINFFGSEEKLVNYTGDRIPIAIADFENNTQDQSLNGLSGLLITSLEQSNYLSVLTKSRMFDFLKQIGKSDVEIIDEKLGVEICRRADIGALVLASIRQFGELYSIDLKILDIETNEYLYTTNVQSEGKRSIPSLIDEISKQTRISLAERAEEVEKNQREIASLTTKNLEAYKYFDLGEKAMYSLNWAQAREYFHKAIDLDSTFAMANYQLAYAYQWNFNTLMADKYIKQAVKYIDSVPDKERLYIRAQSIKDFSSRIPLYEEIIDKYPNEKLAYFELGDMLFHTNKVDESLPYFEKSHQIDPSFEPTIEHLGWSYLAQDDHEKNIELTKDARSIYPNNKYYAMDVLNAYLYAGKFDDFFDEMRTIEDQEIQLINTDFAFGSGYFLSGDFEKAEIRLLKSKDTEEDYYSSMLSLQYLKITQADLNAFVKYSDEALMKYASKGQYRRYAHTLINRSLTLVTIFDDKKNAIKILNEIESLFEDTTKDITFGKIGGPYKFKLIEINELLGREQRSRDLFNLAFGENMTSNVFLQAKQFQKEKEYEKAIPYYLQLIPGADNYGKLRYNYNLGLCYLGAKQYSKALEVFEDLKDFYHHGWGHRALYYPKVFLYSGMANLELKNYRLAKSDFETFLRIWDSAPESLKEKQMARDAMEKINKAIS